MHEILARNTRHSRRLKIQEPTLSFPIEAQSDNDGKRLYLVKSRRTARVWAMCFYGNEAN